MEDLDAQAQLEADEWFGTTSYASMQVPTPTNAGGASGRTASAVHAGFLTAGASSGESDDSDSERDEHTPRRAGNDAASSGAHSRANSAAHADALGAANLPSAGPPTLVTPSAPPAAQPAHEPAKGSAPHNSLYDTSSDDEEEPPPMLSAVQSNSQILELPPPLKKPGTSSNADESADAPPPRLPDLPDLPVLKTSSMSLHVDPSLTLVAQLKGDLSLGPTSPGSPKTPTGTRTQRFASVSEVLQQTSSSSSPRDRTSSHGASSRPSAGSVSGLNTSGGTLRRSSGSRKAGTTQSTYNPNNLPNGILSGELFMSSPQLPMQGFISVECSLIGSQLRWMCKDPMCYGMIELAGVSKVVRVKPQTLECLGVPPLNDPSITHYSGISLKTPTEAYVLAATTHEIATLWRDAVEFHAPQAISRRPVATTSASSGSGTLRRGASNLSSTNSSQNSNSSDKITKNSNSSDKEKEGTNQNNSAESVVALATVKERLGESAQWVSSSSYNLMRLFFHGKYKFIKAIFAVIPSTESDKLAGALARMFFYAEIPLQLIKSVIDWEVEHTSQVNQLFRQDSIASKIMTAYTRLIAQPYLVATLKTHVAKIAKCGPELEINPQHLKPEEADAVGSRIFSLQSTITDLLLAIKQSILLVPTECRLICFFLQQAVTGKFADSKATEIALAGYLFLRLINPAIVVPDSIGIIDKSSLTADGRRALLLVSKIVLNMANQIPFSKEPYLFPFNTFLQEKLPIIQEFIAECAEVSPDALLTETNLPPPLLVLEELATLYRILYPLQDKLTAALSNDANILKRMKQAFLQIGVPPSATLATPNDANNAKDDHSKKDKKEKKDKKDHKEHKEGKGEKTIPDPLPSHLMHFCSKSALANASAH